MLLFNIPIHREAFMTTIAYHHKSKIIAYDSMITMGNTVVSRNHNKKSVCERGWIWFFSGAEYEKSSFISDFSELSSPSIDFQCAAIVVKNDGVFIASVNDGLFILDPINENDSIGSGSGFALSAMKMGLSAREAVKHAASLDTCTGGIIRTYKI